MTPDFSVARAASTETTRHSAQNDEEHTTSSVMPLVNIESSDLTQAPQSTGLHRRSSIEAVGKSFFRSLLPEYLLLHLSLRENQHQIDTHRNSVDSYGDQDKPIETYERNKVALRTLKSNINDNIMVCSGQNNRKYTQLQIDFEKQHQQLYFFLSDNLNCALQTFSSIGSLLNFVDSELLEFITLPGAINPLRESLGMLFDKDQAQYPHSGNAETLQLLCRISCSVNQKLGREPEHSYVKNSLMAMLNYMVAKYMCCRLDSLDTYEPIMQFIEDHGSITKTLFSTNHSFLNEHIIKTIERLPAEISAESLFLLNTKAEDIRKDNEKIILKKAFSVLTGEVRSLTDGVIAFNRVNCSGLGKGHVAKRLFNKMCEFIKDFDDALDTFDKVTDFKPDIDGKFFDTLYKEVLTRAVSADHYYQLVKNRSFHKDISKLFLKGLEKNPAHIELKHLHKQHVEDKIYQQFNGSVDRSRETLIKECQSQIDRIVGQYEREYQDKICHKLNELSESFQQDIHLANFEFTEADDCFEAIT
ncbi:hypothetical protein [Endozoicomonas sp. ONNA2]|uniref:hypothetical protein n=1 Tax=Endozoicomonas sp. ONNA2 TaxID=2828741 RepID=UPI0021492861|nr:hypothetical protein [Endozoicomonas sp. ONNA2]